MSRKTTMTKATYKDVCYALEYGGETLLKTLDHERGTQYFTFTKSGRPVDKSAAQKFMQSPNCMPFNDGLFEAHSQQYGWKE